MRDLFLETLCIEHCDASAKWHVEIMIQLIYGYKIFSAALLIPREHVYCPRLLHRQAGPAEKTQGGHLSLQTPRAF